RRGGDGEQVAATPVGRPRRAGTPVSSTAARGAALPPARVVHVTPDRRAPHPVGGAEVTVGRMSTTGPSVPPPTPSRRPAPVVAEVVRTHRLSPHLVRVVLGGPGLAPFETPTCADSYVKLGFLPSDALAGCPLGADGRVDLP